MDDRPIHILLIEDNPGDVWLIQDMLTTSRGTDSALVSASQISDGLDCLDTQEFDVILLDLSLPGSRGLETFDRVSQHESNLPIVVLTGLDVVLYPELVGGATPGPGSCRWPVESGQKIDHVLY